MQIEYCPGQLEDNGVWCSLGDLCQVSPSLRRSYTATHDEGLLHVIRTAHRSHLRRATIRP
jgi:hypothetical protein